MNPYLPSTPGLLMPLKYMRYGVSYGKHEKPTVDNKGLTVMIRPRKKGFFPVTVRKN